MWLLLFSLVAHADESAVTLKKGQRAPWDGTLLSPQAAAKILVDTDTDLQKCLINAERDLALQQAKLVLEKSNVEAKLAACTLKQTEYQEIYEQRIEFLEKQAITPKWQPPVYYTLGILTGVGIVYGSSIILKNIGE